MAQIDDAINSLSSDELDTLNSDPQMLASFKAKYAPSATKSDLLKEEVNQMPGVVGHFAREYSNIPSDIVSNVKGLGSLASAGISAITDPVNSVKSLITNAPAIAKGLKDSAVNAVEHPIDTVEKNPVSTALTISSLGAFTPKIGGVEGELGGFAENLKNDSTVANFNKKLLGVSESATKMGGASLPSPAPEDVEQAVDNVIKAHSDVTNAFGSDLNDAKSSVGLPTSKEEISDSLRKYGNEYNLDLGKPLELHPDAPRPIQTGDKISVSGNNLPDQDITYKGAMISDSPAKLKEMGFTDDQIKQYTQPSFDLSTDIEGHPAKSTVSQATLEQAGYKIPDVNQNSMPYSISNTKTPEDLNTEIDRFLKNQDYISDKDKIKASSFYQDQIGQHLPQSNGNPDFTKSGDVTQGLLKSKYQQLRGVIQDSSPELQQAKSNFAQTKDALDLVSSHLDADQPGKTQDFLKKVFTSTTQAANDQRQQLAYLEQLSGHPVISDLFKHFAGQEFGNFIGPNGERLIKKTAPYAIGAGLFGHGEAGLGLLASEAAATSPKLIGGLESINPATVGKVGLAGRLLKKPFNTPFQTPEMQSLKDKLANGQS